MHPKTPPKQSSAHVEVERMLGIAAGDLSSAPGLIRMNTIVLPRARAFSFALVFLMVLVHNQVVFGSIDPCAD